MIPTHLAWAVIERMWQSSTTIDPEKNRLLDKQHMIFVKKPSML
jgi:hypothetical protein